MKITNEILMCERAVCAKWLILCEGGKVQIGPNEKAIIYRALLEMLDRDERRMQE